MIKKTNDIHSNSKISEEIINNPFLMLLLQHFQITVPVQDLKVSQLCKLYNINETLFIAFARLYNGSTAIPELKLDHNEALTIVDFLRTSHRFYSEQIYPEIMELIDEMKQLNSYKEMKLVSVFFSNYFQEVTDHLDYENDVFHPYVIDLVNQLNNRKRTENKEIYSTLNYKDHHDDIEEKLTDLKNLLVKYLPLQKDQVVRRKLLFLLSELEFDLKIHTDIEELILIPFTMRLEEKLKLIEK
ncbi:MAG: hypothetical protein GX102_00210 [Porphyromonadaceae bacterium]|jgi:regulator of cell morphogenesis and NO signaling|nr:hypothetical protein [Porphyromonadaceae bacterium]